MRNRSLSLVVLLAAFTALAIVPAVVSAATCSLEPKKLDSARPVYQPQSSTPDWIFAFTDSQDFFVQFQPKVVEKDGKKETTWTMMERDPRIAQFKKLVKREPEKYNATCPFRGVAKLGDKEYAFVLDSPEAGSQSYGLLYFDRNVNGDLTDDGVIESIEAEKARKAREAAGKDEKSSDKKKKTVARTRRTVHQFPPVDLKIEVDGKPVDYRFFFQVHSILRSQFAYASASLRPGVYYEGTIKLDGRRQRVVLVDYNSNGRFDDRTGIREVSYGPKGPQRFYPERGDVVFLDPKPVTNPRAVWEMTGLDFRHNVEKLICVGGNYYNLTVAPSGNELTIEPAEVALGSVKNPNPNYSAILYGELGLLSINGTADQPVAVPEGEWKLVSYKIDLTDLPTAEEKKKEEAKKAAAKAKKADKKAQNKKPSLWAAIGKAIGDAAGLRAARPSSRSRTRRTTYVTAMGTTLGKPVKVVKDETVLLPFGPPYRATVEPSYFQQANDTLQLGLGIYGSAGEAVTGLTINGGRPSKPKLKILAPGDAVADEGNFEYG